jgi:hypothetical protein
VGARAGRGGEVAAFQVGKREEDRRVWHDGVAVAVAVAQLAEERYLLLREGIAQRREQRCARETGCAQASRDQLEFGDVLRCERDLGSAFADNDARTTVAGAFDGDDVDLAVEACGVPLFGFRR